MKVKVNKDLCIGCGLCEGICPKVFKMNEENIAMVLVDTVPEEEMENVKEALECCPVSAIEFSE